jgi:hypothetical protein
LAQEARALPLTNKEPQLSRASLIVVTPLIIRQWEAEIARFSAGKLRVVRIESAAHLQVGSCDPQELPSPTADHDTHLPRLMLMSLR